MSEGSKDASRRHVQDRQSEPDFGKASAQGGGLHSSPGQQATPPGSQLLRAAVDTYTERHDDVDFQTRLDNLRRKNQSLAKKLAPPRRTGQREDPQ